MKTTTYGEIKVGKKKLIGSDYSEEELNKILTPEIKCEYCGKVYKEYEIYSVGDKATCLYCRERE